MEDVPPSQRSAKRKAAYGPHSRGAKSRRMARGRQANVPKFPYHFADQPLRKFVKLRYVDHLNVAAPAVNAITVKEFRANGLYDPDFSIGGHQPYGFDQLMTQYNHFTVLKATFELENMNTQYADEMYYCCALTSDSGTLAAAYAAGGVNGLRELPVVAQTLGVNTYGADVRGSQRKVKLHFDAAKYFGKKSWDIIGEDRFQGDVGADPPEQAFFGYALYSPVNATVAHNYAAKVTLTYFAVLTEPKWFTTS